MAEPVLSQYDRIPPSLRLSGSGVQSYVPPTNGGGSPAPAPTGDPQTTPAPTATSAPVVAPARVPSRFGIDLGAQSSFILGQPYEMPVLDLSARAAYTIPFSDRFALRTSLGAALSFGTAFYDYAEDLHAPAFEDMEYNTEYEFSREHVTRQDVGGILGGVVTPQVELSAQLLIKDKWRWTPHLTLGFNQVKMTDEVTTVSEIKTPDSDIDLNEDPDLERIFYEPVVSQTVSPGVTLDVVPLSFKVGTFEVGVGAGFWINPALPGGVQVTPILEANGHFDFSKKK